MCPWGETPCLDRDLQLNFKRTVAADPTNVASLLVGDILDHKAPHV